MRRAVLLTAVALAGCAPAGPASERGFFGGMAAAVSGEDERRAAAMETEARAAEGRALQARAEALRAERERDLSAAELRDAERRLARLQARLAVMRRELDAARAARAAPDGGRGATLAAELERIERGRAAAAGAPDPEAVRRLERSTQDLSRALEDYRRL